MTIMLVEALLILQPQMSKNIKCKVAHNEHTALYVLFHMIVAIDFKCYTAQWGRKCSDFT